MNSRMIHMPIPLADEMRDSSVKQSLEPPCCVKTPILARNLRGFSTPPKAAKTEFGLSQQETCMRATRATQSNTHTHSPIEPAIVGARPRSSSCKDYCITRGSAETIDVAKGGRGMARIIPPLILEPRTRTRAYCACVHASLLFWTGMSAAKHWRLRAQTMAHRRGTTMPTDLDFPNCCMRGRRTRPRRSAPSTPRADASNTRPDPTRLLLTFRAAPERWCPAEARAARGRRPKGTRTASERHASGARSECIGIASAHNVGHIARPAPKSRRNSE